MFGQSGPWGPASQCLWAAVRTCHAVVRRAYVCRRKNLTLAEATVQIRTAFQHLKPATLSDGELSVCLVTNRLRLVFIVVLSVPLGREPASPICRNLSRHRGTVAYSNGCRLSGCLRGCRSESVWQWFDDI
jgi:hypothetical protein